MATSSNTGYGQTGSSFHASEDGLPELSRYDVLLAAMPLVFGLAVLAHVLLPVGLQPAIGTGALVSCLLLVDAIYINPPAGGSSDSSSR